MSRCTSAQSASMTARRRASQSPGLGGGGEKICTNGDDYDTEASGGKWSGPAQMARAGGHTDVCIRGHCTQGFGTEEEALCEEGPDHGVLYIL